MSPRTPRPAVLRPAAALALALGACGGEQRAARPDVALIVVDTLRADALSCYGNPRPTTPHLDALARSGVLFEQALAHAPNTTASHATLFTGLHPGAHGADNTLVDGGRPAALEDAFVTLAERLAAAGWRTAAFTDGVALGRAWNLLQGFARVECDSAGVAAKIEQALAFLDGPDDGRPRFLFVHTYQVHQPYTAPEPWATRFDPDYDGPLAAPDRANRAAWNEHGELPPHDLAADPARLSARDLEHLVALYHGELAYTDEALAPLLERLDPGWVVAVTSDHGEEFGEHGQVGHRQLFAETLHVPLILRAPDGPRGVRVRGRVGLLDLHATLLAAAGLDAPDGALDLLDVARGGALPERAHFAQRNDSLHLGQRAPLYRSVRLGPRALIERFESDPPLRLAFDLDLDPAEREPLDVPWDDLAERLARHAAEQDDLRLEVLGADGPAHAPALGDGELRALRALGYADDGR